MTPGVRSTDGAPPATRPPAASRAGRVSLLPLGLVVAVAALVVALAGALMGLFAPPDFGFTDGGPLARVGGPVARGVHDVAAATTIGLLLLAGTIMPETTQTHRRATALRLASITGLIWVIASLTNLIFLISAQAGVPVGDPAYGGTFLSVVWSIEAFRVGLISAVLAAVATIGALVVTTKPGMVWMAGIAIAALLPLALAGHSGGAAAHDTAVNSIAVHLVGAAVWLGGLVGLVLLRPVLTGAFAVSVQRYSVVAAWCYGAVAVSGVISALLRVDSFGDLGTAYGRVLLAKVALLLVLGIAGWRMRSSLVGRLQDDETARGAFVSLAVLEVSLMAAAMGLGVALAATAPPVGDAPSADVVTALTGYPAPAEPLQGMAWFTVVRIDWLWLAVAVVGVALYLTGVRRLNRRGDRWPGHRTILWISGWAIFVWATSGAPGVYGRLQFSVHMVMHMTLSMAIPLCLALAAPLTLAARALPARHDKTLGPREILLNTAHSRYLSFFANPIIACLNFFGSLILFYFTGLFELALRTHTGHVVMVVHFLLAGYLFCWILVGEDPGPRRWPPSLRLLLLFATMSLHAFFGVALISGTTLLGGDFFRALNLPWLHGEAALLADQINGGAITWGVGEAPMLILALMVTATWMRSDEHEARRRDRQADRDDEAELRAYNDELARLKSRDTGRR